MYTSIDDIEDPIYLMDLPPSLNYFEFDSSVHQWSNISTPNKLVSSNVDVKKKKTRSKGDRHSKIPTANGLRDRRMRLSLDVARQFFKLQDMLSFDKPSKTVNWLLSQAKSAIEEVDKGEKGSFFDVAKSSSSSVSEDEVVENGSKEKSGKKMKKESRSIGKQVRKKLREEARERARERTQKKINDRLRIIKQKGDAMRDIQTDVSSARWLWASQDCNVFEIEQQIQNGRNDFGTAMDIASNWSSLMSNYHQVNPNQEFQQFHGASREFYSHPNEGNQYFNY